MLDFVVRLTEQPAALGPDNVQQLRDAGFDDRGVLQITLIASWFNYINRVADALGVGRAPAGPVPPP
jgi:alkylhydroperoxidase family enzyme